MIHSRIMGTVVALGLLALTGVAKADTTYSTVPDWDGSSSVSSFGNTNTATYGQTFVAPLLDNVLTDFTFYLRADASVTFQFKAYVYAWLGPLQGNGGGAVGAPLYASPVSLTVTGQDQTFIPVTIDTGATVLTGGANYVALFTVSDPTDYDATTGTGSWGLIASHGANNGGGGFVFFNNANDPTVLNTATWDTFSDFGDTAWTGNFSVPEPGTFALLGMGVGVLGIGGFAIRRRK